MIAKLLWEINKAVEAHHLHFIVPLKSPIYICPEISIFIHQKQRGEPKQYIEHNIKKNNSTNTRMFSISTAAPTSLTASLQCRPHNMIRAPHTTVRVICGSPNGSAATYPAPGLEVEKGKLEKAQLTERSPAPILTLADRMRFGGLIKDILAYKECFVVRSYEVGSNKSGTMETIFNLIQVSLCFNLLIWYSQS